MPKISTFVYCEQAIREIDTNGNPTLTIKNPLIVFRPVFIPSMFSFSVVFGITGVDIIEKPAILQVKFYNSKNNDSPIVDTGEIPVQQPNVNEKKPLPIDFRGMMGNLDFRNVAIKEEGEYYTEIYLDKELIGTFPIYVQVGEIQ